MLLLKSKDSSWNDYYFQKLCDLEQGDSLTLYKTPDDVIKLLKFWNRTPWDNSWTISVIDYEQLIYFEQEYKDNEQIQLLIQTLKEKLAANYKIKALLADNLIDKDIYKDNNIFSSDWGKKIGLWGG